MDLEVTLKTQTINVEIENTSTGLPTATAENDVIMANSSFSWIKKTLAQLKALLGILGFTVETGGYLGAILIDVTTYKDHKYNNIAGNTDWQITGATDGDAGMLIFIIDSTGGYTITMNASSWTKKVGSGTIDTTANAINVVSWRAVGTDIYYTINQVE